MPRRVVILTGNHLCHNPRVVKEAAALANAGFDSVVLGAWSDEKLKQRDQVLMRSLPFSFLPVIDTTDDRWAYARTQLRGKVASLMHRLAHIESRLQLGFVCSTLMQAALRAKADLYIAHSEAGLAAAADLLGYGRCVGLDLEDWFSQDLLPEARRFRAVGLLDRLERTLLTQARHATCPSHAMSEALAAAYGCTRPAVVYNAFPWADRKMIDGLSRDRRDRRVPSIHWFSQTLGSGRGLEDLFSALPLLRNDVEIHLRGNPAAGFESWLRARAPENAHKRIVVHGLVPNAELLSRIAEHDIGFAGETPAIRSRDLTATNKILQYLLAGLAVVASDTVGQREVARQASGAVFLYPSGDSAALAYHLNLLLEQPRRLRRAKAAALRAAERTFCWERQESALLDAVTKALPCPA
jgi:glycosyltransferase involved in cell wall biosynthesis